MSRRQTTFLGIDPSCNGTGIVRWCVKRVELMAHVTPKRKKGGERLLLIRDAVRACLDNTVELVAIENYSLGSENKAFLLGEVGGVVRLACAEFGVPYIEVAPTQLKQFATGNGGASKERVRDALEENTGFTSKILDITDATVLALIAEAVHLGKSPRDRRCEEEVVKRLLNPVRKTPRKRPQDL